VACVTEEQFPRRARNGKENKIKQEIFEGRFGRAETGTMTLKDFIEAIYMPWAKANKKSWLNDDHYNKVILKRLLRQ
jgi:hypothetical protein